MCSNYGFELYVYNILLLKNNRDKLIIIIDQIYKTSLAQSDSRFVGEYFAWGSKVPTTL